MMRILSVGITVLVMVGKTLLPAAAMAGDDGRSFDPWALIGEWSGQGMFVMPVTGIRLSIEGRAGFTYDSTEGYIRTSMVGTKFFYTYQDSGHLYVDEEVDSLVWEIWDGFGKHVIYEGSIRGDTLTGRRLKGSAVYSLAATLVSKDSLVFRLDYIDAQGRKSEKARFNLGRIR
ncbi:MAG: hypothetical protein KAW46_10550 [candidate division Zixibacteria bacterium]|nr:hypothetical protein [candidate division Zixibacteria bacterium]